MPKTNVRMDEYNWSFSQLVELTSWNMQNPIVAPHVPKIEKNWTARLSINIQQLFHVLSYRCCSNVEIFVATSVIICF
jgi:hypothetical protein